MMRLPLFRYRSPRSLEEAARILDGEGPEAMLLAGGTDLLPNMKRRQQVPATLVGLRLVQGLRGKRRRDGGISLGAGLTLSDIERDADIRRDYAALWQAASLVATPQIRNMGTLGGNLCLDTRCTYYDQNYEWRKAIDFCMKKDGKICWVAPSSPKCVAVSSTDSAPALLALGARLRLVSKAGERELPLADFYRNDGIHYIARRSNEILAEILIDASPGGRSAYWKLRRRGSFDFPVLSVAASAQFGGGGTVEEARIIIGAAASRPLSAQAAASFLQGKRLDDATIEECADRAFPVSKPLDNTDFGMTWRKRVTRDFVRYALLELRGDDMRDRRAQIARDGAL